MWSRRGSGADPAAYPAKSRNHRQAVRVPADQYIFLAKYVLPRLHVGCRHGMAIKGEGSCKGSTPVPELLREAGDHVHIDRNIDIERVHC